MADESQPTTTAKTQQLLQEAASLLRSARHLPPSSQQDLANLVEELGHTLNTARVPPDEMLHLAESVAHLAQSLHRKEPGILAATRDRLQRVLVQVEAESPLVSGIIRRLVDALSDIGI